jgi:hypothetical protein
MTSARRFGGSDDIESSLMRLHGAKRTLRMVLVSATAACSSQPPALQAHDTVVIVGVQSEPGAIDSLQIETSLGGAANTDETLASGALPHEVRLMPPRGDTSAAIAVRIAGFQTAVGPQPLLVRTAETSFVPGRTMLLRLMIEGRCLLGLPGGPPGAPSCTPPQSCIGGGCQDDHVTSLETYSPSWAMDTPDICKPLNAGPAVVQVGTGQTDFLPLTDGETIQAEQGPQGGHHVWIAVREENLRQSGSTTTITSVASSSGLTGPKTAFVFTFDPDQGGFCKLVGLRYQLDVDGTDYHQFLGQPLDVTVTVADATGRTGTGVAHVKIAPTVLCPSGISGC